MSTPVIVAYRNGARRKVAVAAGETSSFDLANHLDDVRRSGKHRAFVTTNNVIHPFAFIEGFVSA